MGWPLRFKSGPEPWKDAQIGDCWYQPSMVAEGERFWLDHQLSDEYKSTWLGKRAPIIVYLPPGFAFCVDDRVSGATHGWTVTGSPEDGTLTVSPSINVVGTYHGWIQNGHVSDDVEGRSFPQREAA